MVKNWGAVSSFSSYNQAQFRAIVAMVTYKVMKTFTTCSPIIMCLFDSIVVATHKSGSIDPSKYKCWKLMQTLEATETCTFTLQTSTISEFNANYFQILLSDV